MVNWDRVEELRLKGWDWEKIAADPKVGFHAEPSGGNAGRALRDLYRRRRLRGPRKETDVPGASGPARGGRSLFGRLLALVFLLVPLLAVWFLLAYFLPSPVGLLVPAVPWLGLALAVLAFVLGFALWRSAPGNRWSKGHRNALIAGVVLGLVVAGLIGVSGSVLFGCPYLPSASSLTNMNEPAGLTPSGVGPWQQVPVAAWHAGNEPVFYFYGATWCPFCSASSWAMWKAISEFGSAVPATAFSSYSSDAPSEPDKNTPEVVLADAGSSSTIAVQITEYTGGVDGALASTSSCYQQGYVSAYANGIPFIVIDGQYLHVGSLYSPTNLSAWADGANGGDLAVKNSVHNETAAASGGDPWSTVEHQAWWMMALLAHSTGESVTSLAATYGWSLSTQQNVTLDVDDYLS